MQKKIFLAGMGVIIFLCGMICDRIYLTTDFNETIVPDETPSIPVLNITSVGDGYLRGEITGGKLYIIAGEQGDSNTASTGEIAVPLYDALINYEVNEIPEGAQFVGSKNSNKYHPISSPTAQQIKPENRVYFLTEEEAEKAGYVHIK